MIQDTISINPYSVFHNYKVYRIFSLFPLPSLPLLGGVRGGFLFPVPCSLFPKTQKFVPHPIANRCMML
ncbi:MAG: hypothetical protein F6J90_01030 [Moorea sp. SIOASIH]|uniref:hypothetical protein n=1 Tax=Moorena sp. SIOASIH TaxID=2607817 RepID=UPI0013BA9FA3|nr:hypothetical protein [Moorena sp. SIOASIH]NEO34961.1 hypothetical protein [Moorena sp. SIOASIH]